MIVKEIDISDIDVSNHKFLIPYKTAPQELRKSIESIGIINPPTLVSQDGNLYILTGFKRIGVCSDLNIKSVPCRIIKNNEVTLKDCIKLIYEDNKDRFTDVEIALLCKKFVEYGNDVNEFLELIDYPATEKNSERFKSLSQLSKEILDYYLDEKLSPEQCYLLTQISKDDALVLITELIVPFRFNTNETRELISDFKDISIRDGKGTADIIRKLIESNRQLGKNELRAMIKTIRNPNLSEIEKKFNDIIKELKLPANITFSHSPYFESNHIELKAKISDRKSLRELISVLTKNQNKSLSELLDIIKYGLKK